MKNKFVMNKKRETIGCRSVNLFTDQLEWIDTRKEELGIKSFTEFVRWLIDKEHHTTEILERMSKAIESNDMDSLRSSIGEMVCYDPKEEY